MSSIETKFSSGWVSIKDVVENKYWNVFFDFFKDYYALYRGNKLLCYKKKTNFEKKEPPSMTYDLTAVTLTTIFDERNELYQIEVRFPNRTEPISVRASRGTLQSLLNTIPTNLRIQPTQVGELSYNDFPPLTKPETCPVDRYPLTEKQNVVLQWCQDLLRPFDWPVSSFGEDWEDGRSLQALLGRLRPDTITLDESLPAEESLRQSIEVATQAFEMEHYKTEFMVERTIGDFRKGCPVYISQFLCDLYDSVQRCKEIEDKAENELRHKDEIRAVTEWCNELTKDYEVGIADFDTSWKDGKALLALIDVLRPGKVDVFSFPTYDTLHAALQVARDAFQLKEIYLVCDFTSGNNYRIYTFVKSVYYYCQRNKRPTGNPRIVPKMEPKRDVTHKVEEMSDEEKIVLAWCRKQVETHRNIQIDNFEDSWKDGLALNALIHSIRPEFIDIDHVKAQSERDRIDDGLDAITQIFQIETHMDIDEIIRPDKEKIYRLVSALYKYHKSIYGHMDVVTSDEEAVEPEDAPIVVGNCAKQRDPCPEGMERCENCGFDRKTSELGQEYFKCLECKIIYCRTCKIDQFDHLDKNCKEASEEKARRQFIDDGIIAAFIRKCHKCGIKFGKDGGCNNMQCRCGGTQCYLCRAPDVEYNHFCSHTVDPKTEECIDNCGRKCHLNSNQEEVDRAEKIRVRAQLEEEYKRLHHRQEKM